MSDVIHIALETIPTYDGLNIDVHDFLEDVEYALSSIDTNLENYLLNLVRIKKLQGQALQSVRGLRFKNLIHFKIHFLQLFSDAQTYLQLIGILPNTLQKENETVIAFSNKMKALHRKIYNVGLRDNQINDHFINLIDRSLLVCFIAGLRPEIEARIDKTLNNFNEVMLSAVRIEQNKNSINFHSKINSKLSNYKEVLNDIVSCSFCKIDGHSMESCSKYLSQFNSCQICQMIDHEARNCPKANNNQSDSDKENLYALKTNKETKINIVDNTKINNLESDDTVIRPRTNFELIYNNPTVLKDNDFETVKKIDQNNKSSTYENIVPEAETTKFNSNIKEIVSKDAINKYDRNSCIIDKVEKDTSYEQNYFYNNKRKLSPDENNNEQKNSKKSEILINKIVTVVETTAIKIKTIQQSSTNKDHRIKYKNNLIINTHKLNKFKFMFSKSNKESNKRTLNSKKLNCILARDILQNNLKHAVNTEINPVLKMMPI